MSTISVATGKDTRNKFNKTCQSYTTMSVYDPRITYVEETVPGSSYKIDCRSFVRLEALVRPIMSHVRLHNRFFYVPYRTICANFNRFIADVPTYVQSETALIPSLWKVSIGSIRTLLTNTTLGFVSMAQSSDIPDFYAPDNLGRKLTERGKIVYSLFTSLGYVFDTSTSEFDSRLVSAMPLLAYARVWFDFYRNTAFSKGSYLEHYFIDNLGNPLITQPELVKILGLITTMYFERDMFNSCTLYPTSVNEANQDSFINVSDITVPANSPTFTSGGAMTASAVVEDGNQLTKYGLQLIQSLTDFQKRHQLSGIQPFNRILAEYGVSLKDEQLNRSTFIGDNVVDIEVSDVMSQSYADDTVLGSYAGKGIGFNKKDFRFSTNEFGLLLCISTVVPDYINPIGVKKSVLRTNRLDYFTPTFEHLGTEAVSSAELINQKDSDDVNLSGLDNIFGFLPRYYSYKYPYHCISGNFAFNSVRESFHGWIYQRYLDLYQGADQRISSSFTEAYRSEVSNPFAMLNSHQFIVAHNFIVSAILPMHKLYDDYEFSNEIDNPDHVQIHAQGVQLS